LVKQIKGEGVEVLIPELRHGVLDGIEDGRETTKAEALSVRRWEGREEKG
jgi:hypothetical protein